MRQGSREALLVVVMYTKPAAHICGCYTRASGRINLLYLRFRVINTLPKGPLPTEFTPTEVHTMLTWCYRLWRILRRQNVSPFISDRQRALRRRKPKENIWGDKHLLYLTVLRRSVLSATTERCQYAQLQRH